MASAKTKNEISNREKKKSAPRLYFAAAPRVIWRFSGLREGPSFMRETGALGIIHTQGSSANTAPKRDVSS